MRGDGEYSTSLIDRERDWGRTYCLGCRRHRYSSPIHPGMQILKRVYGLEILLRFWDLGLFLKIKMSGAWNGCPTTEAPTYLLFTTILHMSRSRFFHSASIEGWAPSWLKIHTCLSSFGLLPLLLRLFYLLQLLVNLLEAPAPPEWGVQEWPEVLSRH